MLQPSALLITKLYTPPLRPGLVPRPRLVERLNAGLFGPGDRFARQLTLVCAPAGFGKTTLVTAWLQATGGADRPFTWLSLDPGDNDPVRFFNHLVAALQKVDANAGQVVQHLLRAPQAPPVQALMTSLINDVAATPGAFVLVLDDYHEIHDARLHDALAFLLHHQPPQLHLVVTTRQNPPLPLSRLRVRGQLAEIRADDLRFTAAEAGAFLDQALGLTLDAEIVAALQARTEGWVAGLQLAALALQKIPSRAGKIGPGVAHFVETFGGSHRHVLEYLADEVLARQPGEVRDFLRHTAILDRLTAPLCDSLTGRDDGEARLRHLEQANLFLSPLDDQRGWYRYHPLFADFLRASLEQERQAALHREAARWFAQHDLLPEAVKHALASGDVDLAARMIALAAGEAFRDVSLTTLLGWLNALPDEVVRADGALATYKALVLLLTQGYAEAAPYADAAARALAPTAPRPARGRLSGLQAHMALFRDRPPAAVVQLSRQALACLDDDDACLRALTSNLLGQVLEMQGDVAAAAGVYRDAALAGRRAGDQLGAVVTLTNQVFAQNELGQRRQALALCQAVQASAAQSGREPLLAEGVYLAWSLLSYEADELDLAREQASRTLALCEQMHIAEGIFWGRYLLARTELAAGEFDALRQICQQAYASQARPNLEVHQEAWFAALEAQADLLQSNRAGAARWARAAGLTPSSRPPHHWDEYVYFVYVRLLLAQDRPQDARVLLAALERFARESGRQRKLITIYLQQALVRHALGQKSQALARVEEALRLAAPEGYRRAFLDEGPMMAGLLKNVSRTAPAFVGSLLKAFDTGRTPFLTEPLSEREVEILRLVATGRSNPEIAAQLYLSPNTVKWHLKNLYGKLQVRNRVEAVARAQELDLL